MNLLMISGDRSLAEGRRAAFWYTLEVLRERFDRIDIIMPRPRVAIPHKVPFPNVVLHPSPWPLIFQPLWIARRGKQLMAEHHHAVMTVHEYPPFYNGLGACALSRFTEVPFALEIHHLVGLPVASSFTERIGAILSRLLLPFDARHAAAVRTVNRGVRDVLVRWGVPEAKVKVVPSLYLDAAAWKPDPSVPKEHDIVTCGRLVANKGIEQLLDALTQLPSASLLVIGDGPRRRALERRARERGLSARVTFAGWLPSQEEVAEALRSARIVVMNSRSEGGPRTAVEAMACGLPVVATRVGVMPEVIRDGENGMLVSFATRDLVAALQRLLGDAALRERLGREAAQVAGRFERQRAIGAYADFLCSLSA